MIIGEQQFLTSNWNEFVHIEFLRNLMLKVPNFDMSVFDDIRSVDKVTITTDENHENPITITYLNTEGQHKELHLAPEITARVIKLIKERFKFDLSGEGTDWDQVKINFYDRTSWGEDGPATLILKEGEEEIGLIHIPFIAATGTDHWEDGTLVAPKKVIFYDDNQIVVKSTNNTTIEYDFNIYETKENAQAEYTRLEQLVENEVTTRENADKSLSDNFRSSLEQEAVNRSNADTDLTAKIDIEITDRTNGDAKTLADAKSYSDSKVSEAIKPINESIKTLSDNLNKAQAEYKRLKQLVENEATARENADKTLSANLAQEALNRSNADTDLTAKIDIEITDRTNGDAKTLADAKSYSDSKVSEAIEPINEM